MNCIEEVTNSERPKQHLHCTHAYEFVKRRQFVANETEAGVLNCCVTRLQVGVYKLRSNRCSMSLSIAISDHRYVFCSLLLQFPLTLLLPFITLLSLLYQRPCVDKLPLAKRRKNGKAKNGN